MYQRKVILYISMSLDGYVATENDDLSFLSKVEKEGEDYGYNDFTSSIDTYIVGKKTYDVVTKILDGKFPQKDQYDCYVITRQDIPSEKNLTFYNGDIKELIQKLKAKKGKYIYCDGGPQIVKLLMENSLIDEFIISIIPVILGNGKKLFLNNLPYTNLKHVNTKTFTTGLVQVHYKKE